MLQWTKTQESEIDCMLSTNQVHFLAHMDEYVPNCGDVVELGCWLGASTVLINRYNCGIHRVYDMFKWRSYMDGMYRGSHVYMPGDSFLEEFQRNTVGCKNLSVNTVELLHYQFKLTDQIGVLFFDALKSVHITCNCLPQLLPWMVEGGLVIDQDFMWQPITHIYMHLFMYRLREYFQPIIQADVLVAWKVIKVPSLSVVTEACSLDGSLAEIIQCLSLRKNEL